MLGAPQIFDQGSVIHVNEQALRTLPIQKAVDLTRDDWVMVCKEPRNGGRGFKSLAQRVLGDFQKACSRLNLRVEQPEIITLDREDDEREFEQTLLDYMKRGRDSSFRHPKIVVCILDRETNYKKIKDTCMMY